MHHILISNHVEHKHRHICTYVYTPPHTQTHAQECHNWTSVSLTEYQSIVYSLHIHTSFFGWIKDSEGWPSPVSEASNWGPRVQLHLEERCILLPLARLPGQLLGHSPLTFSLLSLWINVVPLEHVCNHITYFQWLEVICTGLVIDITFLTFKLVLTKWPLTECETIHIY